MAKKKKKKSKNKEEKKERSLSTVFAERLRFSGFYFPKRIDKDLYKVPESILITFKHLTGTELEEKDIEIVYTVNGELSGYYGIIDNEISFVFFNLSPDYIDNIIFKLGMVSSDIGNELSYVVAIKAYFIPCKTFYDKEFVPQSDLRCNICYYSKIIPYSTDMLYKGKLVRSFDKRAILRFDSDPCPQPDVVYDLRKYNKNIIDPVVMSTIKQITNIIKVKSFNVDKLGDNDLYASCVCNKSLSYIGYSKIHFILPEIDNDVLSEFVTKAFDGVENDFYRENAFFNRIGFFINDKQLTSREVYDIYYKKHHNEI